MAEHLLDGSVTHAFWDASFPPRLEIEPGDTVTFECREPLDGQVTPASDREVWATLDLSRVHSLVGPVRVRGARPGDTLEIEILAFEHAGWGWTGWFPGAGLLHEEFRGPYLQHWRIEGGSCALREGGPIRVPYEPFCGVMGVAPEEAGRFTTLSPGRYGGNVDVRHLTVGARAFLPVFVEGAGFSTGDGHAAQGDGEVCSTAIEAPLTVTMRFRVRRDLRVPELQFEMPHHSTRSDPRGHEATTGHGTDLHDCAQDAVCRMIDRLEMAYGLSREQAYCLCSVAGDLKISQFVMERKVVAFYLPRSVVGA